MRPYATWAVGLVSAALLLAQFVYYPKYALGGTEATISWDVAGYYMYLPAAFVYGDLAGDAYHDVVTAAYGPSPVFDHAFRHEASGAYVMKYSAGMALQYAPFFAVAHAFATATDAYPADGFSLPYQLAVNAEVVAFALLSLLLLRRLLRHYFPEAASAWAIVAVGLGTNYLEYASIGGAHAHLNLFCYYAAVALLARRFYADPRWGYALGIGACVGIATLSRPTELLMALVPLLWGLRFTGVGLAARGAFLRRHALKLLGAAGIGAAIIALQPLYWHWATGEWAVYSYQDQGFSFLRMHFLKGLTSFRGGWLPYTPMGLLMLAGFWPLRRRYPDLAPGLLAYVLVFMYVAWSWDLWRYGGSLGQRTMVQVYPLLSLPLAALFEWVLGPGLQAWRQWGWRRWGVVAGFGVSLLVNLYWTHQAHRGGLFRANQMTAAYYWRVLGTFGVDRFNERFLDRVGDFEGVMRQPVVVAREGYETTSDAYACTDGPLAGARSLCIVEGSGETPVHSFPKPPPDKTWVRVSFDVDVREKTWEAWAMAEVTLSFVRADGRRIRHYYLKPERLVDGGRHRLHFDGRLPREDAYDHLELSVWKPGLGGRVLLDEVEVLAFGG